MKVAFFIVSFFIVIGCGTTPNTTFNQGKNARTPHFDVKKITGSEYHIVFYGSPLSSHDEMREEWDFKAKGVCQGVYEYKNYESAAVCGTESAYSCIEVSDVLTDAGQKVQPKAVGVALCATSDEPKIVYSSVEENKTSSEVKDVLIVKQLDEKTYFVEYAGLPDGSIEIARNKWHERAAITCNGNEYEHKLSRNSMWQADLKPTGENINVKHKVKGSYSATNSAVGDAMFWPACVAGGAVGCMILSLMVNKSETTVLETETTFTENENASYEDEVRFPVVEGRVFCK